MNHKGIEGKVLLASPRGFCAGVVRAIDTVNLALEQLGPPLYVRREIVHNRYVVEGLRKKGVVFIQELGEVPQDGVVIFSAHGVAPEVRAAARARRLRVIDATCPLVTKVHIEALKYARAGFTIILVGHENHEEVVGTRGEAPESIRVLSTVQEVEDLEVPDPDRVAYLTQTTLSFLDARQIIEALRCKFPNIRGPASHDICYATQNRQNAILELARQTDVILVVGSPNSSNSRRLVEVAAQAGVPAHLIDDTGDIRQSWLQGADTIGLTAGASAPEELVGSVLDYLRGLGYADVETLGGVREDVHFALPSELTAAPARGRTSGD